MSTKKVLVYTAGVSAIIILIGFSFFRGEKQSDIEFVIAERADIVFEVSVTGRVVPIQSVELAFEKGGKVAAVFVDVGDIVNKGAILVQLEQGEIVAEMMQAEANVKIQQANLDDLRRGSREEEILVEEAKVLNAEVSLGESRTNVVDTIQDALTKSDDAIRNKVDQFISNPSGINPEINFFIVSQQLKLDIEKGRMNAESALVSWQASLIDLAEVGDLSFYTGEAKSNLNIIKFFLNDVALAVNAAQSTTELTQTTIDAYKVDVSSARTNINGAISSISTAGEKFKKAESALFLSKQELILAVAGTVEDKIVAQKAKVEEAEANVLRYSVQLSKTVMRAPISGVVTLQNAKVGEIITANEKIVVLISESQFEIKAQIPEADIAQVQVDDEARVTLDAYGADVSFEVFISDIDPAENIIDGLATYGTTLQFLKEDERIKSGMTANINIESGVRKNVVAIPSRAVIRKEGKKIVRILVDGEIEEVEVEVGLRGSDGNIEIIRGINEGDKVVIFIND
ncbi:efflux RND transporter periplasmic adaptor subunit [Patescibacteria group bacterium]|nr:efflux RND transporter periplasmic adaptor subunit [Patescibacteria group bacterium]